MQQKNNDSGEPENNNNKTDIKKLLIVGAFAVVAAIIASTVILHFLLKNDEPEEIVTKQTAQTQTKAPEDIAKDDNPLAHGLDKRSVMDAVALSLFDNGLDIRSIKDSSETQDGETLKLRIIIDPGNADLKTLKISIADKLKGIVTETEIGDSVSIKGLNLSAEIEFIEKKAEKPVQEKKPAVNKDFGGAKIAFVIDDCGYSIPLAEKLGKVKYPMAMAIIPYTPHGKETAEIFRKYGKTVFLHQPMEPKSYPQNDPGKGAILLNMPESLVEISLRKNIEDIGGKIDGFNNHMGSGLTESREKMRQVFNVMNHYTDFYVDSYTSPATVAYDECLKSGMVCAINNKFIDNESDLAYIRGKIMEGVSLAKAKGSIIMIGHLRDATVSVLVDILPELEAMGVEIVPVRELAAK